MARAPRRRRARQLLILAHASTPSRVTVVTYRTPDDERLTVVALRERHSWRISTRRGDRWLRVGPSADRELLW